MQNYSAWNISNWDYPTENNIEEKIKYFAKFGILSANIHNTQPWKFKIEKASLEIIPEWDRRLTDADPTGKNLWISLGCCVKNIEVISAYHDFLVGINIIKNEKDKK